MKQNGIKVFRLSRVGWFSLVCVQTPLPSVKIGEGAPSPIFTERRGICTQARSVHAHLLFRVLYYTWKKITVRLSREKYTYPARSSINSPYFQQARRLFRFRSQLIKSNFPMFYFPTRSNILLEERVFFCRVDPLGTPAEKSFETILLANILPMYIHTYILIHVFYLESYVMNSI